MTRHSTISEEQQDKARRAVSAFRRLQPVLTSYARNLSGNPKVRVEVAARDNGSTDGKTIFYRPPIELGNDTPHVRAVCNQRAENLQLICPACNVREDVLSTIFHEIAHIWHDSFAEVSFNASKLTVQRVTAERGQVAGDALKGTLYRNQPKSYMELAHHVDEFFPFLINCLEDARVNRELFKALPGTEIMFQANTNHIFADGVQQLIDGEWQRKEWKDYPLNPQIMLGTFCIASGYDYRGWFAPVIEEALGDAALNKLLADQPASFDETFRQAFPIRDRLRELGFCVSPKDNKSEDQEEEGESSEAGSEAGESGSNAEGLPGDNAGDQEAAGGGDRGTSPGGPVGAGDSVDEDVHGPGDAGDDLPASHSDAVDPAQHGGEEVGEVSGGGQNPGHDAPPERAERGSNSGGPAGPGTSGDEASDSEGVDDGDPIEQHFTHGTRVEGECIDDEDSDLPMGTPDEVKVAVLKFGDHEEIPHSIRADILLGEQAVDFVIIQGVYFETPPINVAGVKIFDYQTRPGRAWREAGKLFGSATLKRIGTDGDFAPDESIVGPALLKARVAFAANDRGKVEINTRRGKIRPSALGRRAPVQDDRMFQKKTLPGRKSYHVVIGLDISASTQGANLVLEKQMAILQGAMLSRLGISFEMWAHSSGNKYLHMYKLKEADQPWTSETERQIGELSSDLGNLDGHALEFLRRQADKSPAKTKIILYTSDGAMPAENKDEELDVLQREIKTCRKRGYVLLGVGIRCNSPQRHGLETTQVDSRQDLAKVIEELRKRLT